MENRMLHLQHILLDDASEQRVNRLAKRLDIDKSEVIMTALKLYEEGLNSIDDSFRRLGLMSFEMAADLEKMRQGLVKLGDDVGEPINPERLRELLGTKPDDCPFCNIIDSRYEFVFEAKE